MKIPAFDGVIVAGLGAARPRVQPVKMPRGDSATGSIIVRTDDGAPANLTGGALVLTVFGLFGRELDFIDATQGTASFDLTTADTFSGRDSATYRFEIIFIDNAGRFGDVGGRYQVVPPSPWFLGETLSNDPPQQSPAPSQTALAQGPGGPGYAQRFLYTVKNTDGDAFYVPIPVPMLDGNYGVSVRVAQGQDFIPMPIAPLTAREPTRFYLETQTLDAGTILEVTIEVPTSALPPAVPSVPVAGVFGSGVGGALEVQDGQTVVTIGSQDWASVRVRAGGTWIPVGEQNCQIPIVIDGGGVVQVDGQDGVEGGQGGPNAASYVPSDILVGRSGNIQASADGAFVRPATGLSGEGGTGNDGTQPTANGGPGITDADASCFFPTNLARAIFGFVGTYAGSGNLIFSSYGGAPGTSGGGDGTGTYFPPTSIGGGGAGMLLLRAPKIINNGTIRARGGRGLDGPIPPAPTPPGTGIGGNGGGNGGNGGPIILVGEYSGTGTIDISGGAPGRGSPGTGVGTPGTDGSPGGPGWAYSVDPSTGAWRRLA